MNKSLSTLIEKLLFIIQAIIAIPLVYISKFFYSYTEKKQYARAEKRFTSILESTEDFSTWRETAQQLDKLRGFSEWQHTPTVGKYVNAQGLVYETRVLVSLYSSASLPFIGEYLRTHIARNAHGLTHPLLFRYYSGTKAYVEAYIRAVCALIRLYSTGVKTEPVPEPPELLERDSVSTNSPPLSASSLQKLLNSKGNLPSKTASPLGLTIDTHPLLGPSLSGGNKAVADPRHSRHSSFRSPTSVPAPFTPLSSSTSSTLFLPSLAVEKGTNGDPFFPREQRHQNVVAHYTMRLKTLSMQRGNTFDAQTSAPAVPLIDKYRLLLQTAQSFGRSALMLSGGASLGIYHAGVVRALYCARLLPQIIAGSSAGSIIGSILCTRTEAELDQLLRSEDYSLSGVSMNAFDSHGDLAQTIDARVRRLITNGACFDLSTLQQCLKQNFSDMTFKEAFERTGRVLNISAASLREGENQDRATILNYLTTPNVIIWSAVSASCAMPGLFTAVELLEKDPATGRAVSYLKGQKFCDGSTVRDVPKEEIARLFNVNYFIVSQTNPHVIPFLRTDSPTTFAPHGHRSPSLVPHLWYAAALEVHYWLVKLHRFGLLPTTGRLSLLYRVLTQSYTGELTILPIGSIWNALPDYVNMTANPTPEYMEFVVTSAQRKTWPYLTQLYIVTEIERTLQEEIKRLREEMRHRVGFLFD